MLATIGLVRYRERRIRERNQELERTVAQRTEELVKANAAKDEFLASISHEIRNPLNGVVGLAAAIEPGELTPATRVKFDYLRHCATHLSGLLEDILDFSKLEAGAVTLKSETFDLHELVRSVPAVTADESARSGLHVDVAMTAQVPRWVVGDPARIRQIVINFVINALRYAGRGEVQLTVWGRSHQPDRCTLTFAVSDEGPGIAPEEQARLFTRFQRGAAGKRSRTAGSGIGLSVCKSLAEKMGGRLWVESQPGEGSTFYFEVALPVSAQVAPVDDSPLPLQWDALIVDDEAYNRVAASALVQAIGFRPQEAADGPTALALAREHPFDVVLLDFDMPGMTGPQIARELRALPGIAADLVIVGTTAFVTADKHSECRAAGMNSVISKPVTRDKLRAALTESSAHWRAVAPLHVRGDAPPDPLATLRLLADRTRTPLERQVRRYFEEMDAEIAEISAAIEDRDPASVSAAAHRLTGRLASVAAAPEEQLARELEAAAVNENWERALPIWNHLQERIGLVREQLTAAVDRSRAVTPSAGAG